MRLLNCATCHELHGCPGCQVCLHYKNLRNDEALLDYGFLLPDRPPLLCKVDHWEYAAAEGDSGGGAESMSTTTLGSAAATRTWHQVHVPADDVFPAESFEHFQTEIKRLNAIVETMAKTPKTTEVLASATRSLYASGKKRSALYLQGMSATARELLADFRGLRKLALRTTINQLHIDVADAMQDWLMNTDWMGGRNTEGDDAEDGRVEGGHAEGGHAEL